MKQKNEKLFWNLDADDHKNGRNETKSWEFVLVAGMSHDVV